MTWQLASPRVHDWKERARRRPLDLYVLTSDAVLHCFCHAVHYRRVVKPSTHSRRGVKLYFVKGKV